MSYLPLLVFSVAPWDKSPRTPGPPIVFRARFTGRIIIARSFIRQGFPWLCFFAFLFRPFRGFILWTEGQRRDASFFVSFRPRSGGRFRREVFDTLSRISQRRREPISFDRFAIPIDLGGRPDWIRHAPRCHIIPKQISAGFQPSNAFPMRFRYADIRRSSAFLFACVSVLAASIFCHVTLR